MNRGFDHRFLLSRATDSQNASLRWAPLLWLSSFTDQRRASNTLLKGVSVALLNTPKPPDSTTSRRASSDATAPKAGPPNASEFAVQQSVEAPAKQRPIILKFSSTVLPAIGSTIIQLPPSPRHSAALSVAPSRSPMSCKQSKKQIRSKPSFG